MKMVSPLESILRSIRQLQPGDGTLDRMIALKNEIQENILPVLAGPASLPTVQDIFGLELRKRLFEIMRLQSVDYERFFKEAEIFLDFAICLASETNVVEPSFPMVMIEDLMDILTLDGAIRLFDYIESRVDLLVKDIDPMKGKGLVLLRFCNELLRRLSKTKNTVFCGRILIFLTSIYPLTERSGVNLRGDFNLDNVTLYENYEDTRNVKPLISPAPDFYILFWGLQKYLSNPPLLFAKESNWKEFQTSLERTLMEFDRENEEVKAIPLLKTSEKDRKRKGRHEPIEKIVNFEMQEGFFPKYLTSRKLFNLQLKDPFFRRQILVQFTIIYQFLLSLAKPVEIPVADAKDPKVTPPVPVILNKSLQYPFSISESQEKWVLDTRTKSLKILEAISPHLKRFSSTTHTVITHEKNWVKWKSDLCPSFEKAPVKFEAKRRRLEMSIAVQKDNLGSDELTKLWTLGKNPLAVLADKSRGSVIPQLEDFLEPLTDQLNPDGTVAEGVEDEYLYSNDKLFNWKAYRLAIRQRFDILRTIKELDTKELWKKALGQNDPMET